MTAAPPLITRSLFAFSLLYGGLVVLAGVLGTKLAALGHWPLLGDLAVESGIFAFLLLVVISSAVAELHGQDTANRLVRLGFVPLIVSMALLGAVIHVVPPAPFWHDQDAFARLLGQGARMQFAGLVSYGISQTLNVAIFARLAGGQGRLLLLRAWVASVDRDPQLGDARKAGILQPAQPRPFAILVVRQTQHGQRRQVARQSGGGGF